MNRTANQQPAARKAGTDDGNGEAGLRQVDTGYRERGRERQPIVHDDPREDFRRLRREVFEKSLELAIGDPPVAQLKKIHPESLKLPEVFHGEAANRGDRAVDGAFGRSEHRADDGAPQESRLTACGKTHVAQFSRWGLDRRSIPAEPLRFAAFCVAVEIHPGQFSRWGLLPHAPCQPGASPPPGELAGLGAHVGFTTGC